MSLAARKYKHLQHHWHHPHPHPHYHTCNAAEKTHVSIHVQICMEQH